ncbi:hypothetical protein RFI_23192 [Reticulomyxa filosa]|uniref:Uncharacterized protein n=1 Tax=Reticulomyxa filosa TaxID=46433 RepID=X6MKK0_RETFI|nr:hypothetical protein RFI_23192 [Reticulomyxa filosa]|eukprot:ETO14176.1 hypothetical protein RFI_23192 [Reticulomyxa filosa]
MNSNFEFMEQWFNYYSHCDHGAWRYVCLKNMSKSLAAHCREMTALQTFYFVGVMFAESDWHMSDIQRNKYKQLAPGHMERAMIKKRIAQLKQTEIQKQKELENETDEQKQQKLANRKRMVKILKKIKKKMYRQRNDAEILEKAQQKAKKQPAKDTTVSQPRSPE